MSVTPNLGDRVLYRAANGLPVFGGKLWAADVLQVLTPILGIQHVRLQVWTVWPLGESDPSYEVADSAQALDLDLLGQPLAITAILANTWRSIVEITGWRSYVGT